MGQIIRENGKIWLLEYQTADKRHRKLTLIGTYDENEEEPKKTKRKKSNT